MSHDLDDEAIEKLQLENDRLRRLCRFQFFTLGFYATKFNYESKNWAHHPETGEVASGVLWDNGHDARQAHAVALGLGFTRDEIAGWSGPGVDIPYGEKADELYKKFLDL